LEQHTALKRAFDFLGDEGPSSGDADTAIKRGKSIVALDVGHPRSGSLGRKFQLAWTDDRVQWWTWGFAAIFAIAALIISVPVVPGTKSEAAVLDREGVHVSSRPSSVQSQPIVAVSPDFAQHLGTPLPTSRIAQELQRACAQAGVTLITVQAQSRAPSQDQLGRLEIAVNLRGNYTSTKQALKQVIDRFPNHLTVSRLRMQRGTLPGDVESQVTLSVWSTPLTAATAEGVIK
jgi:hypothetical protein